MVEFNPEEERKGNAKPTNLTSTPGPKKKAHPKTVIEICARVQECILDADRHNVDFINFLCDAAMNLDADTIETERSAVELFTSDDFGELGNLVNSWKNIYPSSRQNLADFLFTFEKGKRDGMSQTLIFVWPFLFLLLDNAAQKDQS